MAERIQEEIQIQVIVEAVEQKFAANVAITGIAPALAPNPFTPYYNTADGILRYKQADDVTKDEADEGGLFTLANMQPGILEWLMMDLGASVAYTVAIVTSAGEWQVDAGTAQYVIINPKAPIMPGETVKVTAAAPGAGKKSWVRIYLRSDQARH